MKSTNIIQIVLLTTVLIGGISIFHQIEKKENNFLTHSAPKKNFSQDPCGTIQYRSHRDFEEFLNKFKNGYDLYEKVHIIREEIGLHPGVFSSKQAMALVDAAGNDLNMRIEVLKNIVDFIIYFTTTETIEIIESTQGGENEKLEFLKQLAPFIKDPTDFNKRRIINLFDGYWARLFAEDCLKNAKGVDCIWGEIPEKVATFVIDVSGSMNVKFLYEGKEITRLDYIKQSLKKTISTQLREYQKFNIVQFSSNAFKWKRENVPATRENIESALRYIDTLRASGGTNISYALYMAFQTQEDLRGVYLLSDGYPNYGVQKVNEVPSMVENLEKKQENHVVINTISFMLGNKVPQEQIDKSKEFLEAIAKASRGSFKQMISD